jgi:hypothetical protein
VVPLRHEGLQDRRGDVGVIARAQDVADVVQQGADDIFLILAAWWARVAVCRLWSRRSMAKPPQSPFSRFKCEIRRVGSSRPNSIDAPAMMPQSSGVPSTMAWNLARSCAGG